MSSVFSKPFRNIFGSKISENITQGTSDKWLAPETKDLAEKLTAMAVLPGILGTAGVTGAANNIVTGAVAGGMNAGGVGGAVMGALTGILLNLPGDIGKFFQSGLGQGIMSALGIGAGGDISHIGNILDQFGLSGKQKDAVEGMLTMAALAAFSNKFAKDALNEAKKFESYEQDTVKGLMNTANSMSDPKIIEQNVQKSLEKTNQEYERAQQQTEQDLYARGLGLRTLGATEGIGLDQAAARAQARRDIETAAPLNALQAQAAVLPAISNYAERLRATAEAERALPMNLYESYTNANKKSPMEDYYAALAAQQAGQQQTATNGQQQTATNGYGFLAGGLSGLVANAFNQPVANTSGFTYGGQYGNIPVTSNLGMTIPVSNYGYNALKTKPRTSAPVKSNIGLSYSF